jgi:hypothetical protein
MPSSPATLIPHVQTVPSDRSARSSSLDPAIATTRDSLPVPDGPTTDTGSLLQALAGPAGIFGSVGQCSGPSSRPPPSWPQILSPQVRTFPFRSRAALAVFAETIAVIPVSCPRPPGCLTATGRVLPR